MLRRILVALATGVTLLGATAAQAETYWSIGINLPPAGVVVTNGPRYYVEEPVQMYYEPAPVVRYAPAPRYYHRHVYDAPPPRVVYEHAYREHRWDRRSDRWESRHGHDRYDRQDRRERQERYSQWDDDHNVPRRGR